MPYSDIGQGLMAAGGAFSDAIRERRLRREQEEEKRKQELLAMLQRQSMAKVLGPGNEDLLNAGLEPATALAEKKRREDEKKSEKGRQDREKALRDAYIGGRPNPVLPYPVPPDVESQIQLGAQETDPTQVMNLMNKLSRNQPTPDVAGNATMFGVDQNQLAALVGQGMSVPDAVTKLKGWQEKPDQDPQAKKWQQDIAIRRKARELIAAGKQDEAEELLQDHALSLVDTGVVSEKSMRLKYESYAKKAKDDRETPELDILMSTGAFGSPDPLSIVNQKLGPVSSFGEWLQTPEAMQLNPDLAQKLIASEQKKLDDILAEWQLAKVDTSPDEFIDMVKRTDEYKGLDEYTLNRLRSMLK